jgi:hypothetical protein
MLICENSWPKLIPEDEGESIVVALKDAAV